MRRSRWRSSSASSAQMELHPSSASIAQKEATSIIWPMMERGSIQERYFDPQFDGFALPDLDDRFDDDYRKYFV
ncbi:hypothetical protein ACOSP7_021178 [Xanthoceras sorbifolium]